MNMVGMALGVNLSFFGGKVDANARHPKTFKSLIFGSF